MTHKSIERRAKRIILAAGLEITTVSRSKHFLFRVLRPDTGRAGLIVVSGSPKSEGNQADAIRQEAERRWRELGPISPGG